MPPSGDPQQLCLDIEAPEQAKALIDIAIRDFEMIHNHFDALLKNTASFRQLDGHPHSGACTSRAATLPA